MKIVIPLLFLYCSYGEGDGRFDAIFDLECLTIDDQTTQKATLESRFAYATEYDLTNRISNYCK